MTANVSRRRPASHRWTSLVVAAFGAFLISIAVSAAGPPEEPLVLLNRTPMELKQYVLAPGERLYKPGKERIAAAGRLTLLDGDIPRTETVQVTWQIPLKVRLDRGGTRLEGDWNKPGQSLLQPRKIVDAIQTLLEDSVEGLFALQKDRISRRYLGSGFKLDSAEDSSPGMDVVLLTYPDNFRNRQPLFKSYWFDSGTKLLGVVVYASASGADTHVVVDDWRDVSGERLPFRIERWEDGKLIMRLILDSAAFVAGANDGTFGED